MLASLTVPAAAQAPVRESLPQVASALVKDFVIAGHGNLVKCRELLFQTPKLINACWDWGGGDFETALGGAAHMGNRETALYLLEQGARLDVFAAAMLGKLEIVRAAVEAFSNVARVAGPHGIPLIEHARKGGIHSEAVLRFLEDLHGSSQGTRLGAKPA